MNPAESSLLSPEERAPYRKPTSTIESEHPEIVAFARRHAEGAADERDAAVRLYYAVRDGLRYDPYGAGTSEAELRASAVLASGRGWCVAKAIVLAACHRAVGLPARLGFADVRNHLSTERMRRMMQTDVFYWHGYTSTFLDGRWVKSTPAFNVELCEKFGLHPLEWDGREDSIYHPFDVAGNRHMEYVTDHGEFADLPLETMQACWREHYPHMQGASGEFAEGDFEAEVEAEVADRAPRREGRATS